MPDEFAPVIFIDVYKTRPPRFRGRAHRQPWRWRALSAGNFKVLASGESYANEADAVAAVRLLFAATSTAYLRRREMGNERLRLASVPS